MLTLILRLLSDHCRALLRFPAARRALAFACAAMVFIAFRLVDGFPPPGLATWPSEAREAALGLMGGFTGIAAAAWTWAATRPLEGFVTGRSRLLVRATRTLISLRYGVEGIALVLRAAGLLQHLPTPGIARVWNVATGAIVPALAIGALPLVLYFGAEWTATSATYARLFRSGAGASGGWLHPYQMRAYLKPPSAVVGAPPHGVVYNEPLVGLTPPEHGSAQQAVHLQSPAFVTVAASGSGKLLTDISHHCCLGWDAVFISPKPDLADCGIGYRADPSLWDQPELVEAWGRELGIDVRGVTQTRYHLSGGRVMNVDCGRQTAFPLSRYTFLCDIDPQAPTAMSRLTALAEACFPVSRQEKDPFWILAAQGAFTAAMGHTLTYEVDPARHNFVFVTKRLLGIDPATNLASEELAMRLFREMARNPSLGGFIAGQGAKLVALGERTMGPLMKSVENGLRWVLADPRMCEVLEGPSDFSIESFGRGKTPLTAFVTPVRGDRSTDAFLSCFLSMAVLVWQQRGWTPERPIALVADEVPNWGGEAQVRRLTDSFNILRDKKVVPFVYGQTLAQFFSLLGGATGVDEMLSAATLRAYGVRDKTSLEYLRDRLGQTTVRRDGRRETVYVADTDAIARELAPGSALQYVFPYDSGRPMRLLRAAYADVRTREGLHAPVLPYHGHFDHGLPPYRR